MERAIGGADGHGTVSYRDEFRVCHPDGTVLWLESSGTIEPNGGSLVTRGIVRDITKRKQAEAQLRENEERLRVLTTAMPQLVWAYSSTGECVYQSPQWETVTGQSATDSLKFGWTEMIHPEDRVRTAEEWRRTVAQGTTYHTEHRLHMKDGTYRWYLIRAEPLRDESGALMQWIGTSTDIDEAKRTEAALRQSEERLRLATQAAAVGIWEWNVKTNQIRWDAQMFKIYQTAPTADGLVPYSIWSDAVVPDDLPEQERTLWQTVRTCGSSCRQFRIRRYEEGEVRVIEAVETVRVDDQGATEWVVGTNIDVTERKQAEAALRESEERYRATFANAAVGIGRVDFHTATWIDVNDALCQLVGYSREEMLETPWPDITYPDDVDLDLVPFHRMAAGDLETYSVEKRFIHRQGHTVWARLTLSLMRTAAGAPDYEIAIVENIDERKRTEMTLHDAQQRLQRWNIELEQAIYAKTVELHQSQARLRALATELNLAEQRERTRIATELHDHLQQMLVLGKLKLGMHKRFTETAPAAAKVMKETDEVLSDALTYSRILVAELSPPVLRDHGLAAGFKWLAESMKQKYGMTVTVTVPEENGLKLPEDQTTLLFQSVRELLINSWKHAGTGQATVSMEQRDGLLRILVSDTGAGFDLAAAADTPSGGISSKFGLFSIRERMRALDGGFDIESSPGRGTTATLVLPLATPIESGENNAVRPLSPVARVSLATIASRNTLHDHLIRVLLVDDHAMVRQGLGAILNGYPDIELVGEAADGEEAVALAERLRPTVILMDINMPKKNGIEAAAEIKARHPEMIVIGLSVNANGENHTKMMEAGASMLLSKEAAVEHLYGAITDVMREHA